MKQELEQICALNPENLGAATPQDFLFKYIDISSVEKGCIHWDQVSRYKFSEAPSRARRRVKKDDVLLCTVRPGLQAHARISNEGGIPFVASTGFAALRPYNKEDSSFIFHQIFSNDVIAQLRPKEVGSSYPAVNESDVKRLSIFMPEPSQRKAIGKVLDTIDEAIAQTEAVIAKLKQVRAGMLHDLLSYGLDEHGQLRDPIAHPEQFKDSPLGLIPREWEAVKLGDAFSMQAGKFLSSGNIKYFGQFPVFGGNGLRGYATTYTHEGEYALIGRQGALCGNIMVASGQFYATEHAVVVTPKEEMNVGWIASYLTAMNLNRFSESSAQPGLSVHKLSHHRIKLPKFPEQEAIDFQIKAIDQQLSSEAAALAKLGSLKSGLQDDLLTGRVRVPETIMEGAESA